MYVCVYIYIYIYHTINIGYTKSNQIIIMLGRSGRFEKILDHTSSRILFSQCELCSTNKTKFIDLKYKHYTT